jgi:ribosomal protein L1
VELEAAKLAKETSSKKRDATVEVATRLGVDPRSCGPSRRRRRAAT